MLLFQLLRILLLPFRLAFECECVRVRACFVSFIHLLISRYLVDKSHKFLIMKGREIFDSNTIVAFFPFMVLLSQAILEREEILRFVEE